MERELILAENRSGSPGIVTEWGPLSGPLSSSWKQRIGVPTPLQSYFLVQFQFRPPPVDEPDSTREDPTALEKCPPWPKWPKRENPNAAPKWGN